MPFDIVHQLAYNHAEAMLAEKALREADHSGDANKMHDGYIVDENGIPEKPAERHPEQDHSPDAGKMAELKNVKKDLAQALDEGVWIQAANRELVEALQLAVTHVEFFTSAPKGSMAADARTALISKCSAILAKHRPIP